MTSYLQTFVNKDRQTE